MREKRRIFLGPFAGGALALAVALLVLGLPPFGLAGAVGVRTPPRRARVVLVASPTARLFTVRNAKPGTRVVKTLTITNRGSASGVLWLSATASPAAPLAGRLLLRVALGRRVLYSGPLASFTKRRVGTIRARGKLAFSIAVTLPAGTPTVDNPYAGKRTVVSFRASAAGR